MHLNKLRLISLLCTSAGLAACGSGSGGASNVDDSASVIDEPTTIQSKSVMISRLPTIPTNGSIGQHYLRISNNTGETLKLKDFKISKSDSSKILDRIYNSINRAVGGVGYDARISVATCETLLKNASCTIAFTPDSSDGSTGVQLNFTANNGEQFSAAQLINYSSSSTQHDGFIVNNDAIQNVDSTVNYSISIPFITDDDYETIDVVSRIITLDKRVDCTKDVSKGAHCTATLTLPVASAAGYANAISLVGKKADGTQKIANLSSGSRAIDTASVVMTNQSQVLKADKDPDNNKLKVIIVNNGNIDATGLTDDHTAVQSWLDGVTDNTGITYLTKNSDCLNNAATAAGLCEVEFTLSNANATGFDRYQIGYTNGYNGAGVVTSQTTALYYKGLITDGAILGNSEYGYTVSGGLNFDNTSVNQSITQTLSIQNTGKNPLYKLRLDGLPTEAGFTETNNCSEELKSGDSCFYNITYAPKAVVASTFKLIKVLSYKQVSATPEDQVSPAREFTLSYGAVDTGGVGFVFLTPNPEFLAELGGVAIKKSIMMQNTGAVDYTLKSVSLPSGQVWPDKLVVTAPDNFNGKENPLKGLQLTNGVNLSLNQTIAAGASAVLDYVYGPFAADEAPVPQSTVTQNFEAAGGSLNALISSYEVKAPTVTITEPEVEITEPDGSLVNPLSGNSFTLLKTTKFKMTYEYKASATDVTSLLIHDSDLPYGFTVDKANTNCKTLSTGNSAGADLVANANCKVTYLFVAPDVLSHSLFYTAAANASTPHTMIKPGFSYLDAAGKRVYVANSQEFKFTAKPFAKLDATLTKETGATNLPANTSKYKLTVTSSDYDAALDGKNIIVKPIAISGVTLTGSSCTVSKVNPSCDLEMLIADTLAGKSLPVNYSTSFDSDYNSINQNVSIN